MSNNVFELKYTGAKVEEILEKAEKIDLSNYPTKSEVFSLSRKTIVLSSSLTSAELVAAISTALPGTEFDIQGSVSIFETDVTFPDDCTIYSSTNNASITFGYAETSDFSNAYTLEFGKRNHINGIHITLIDNATAMVQVSFGDNSVVADTKVYGYEPVYKWGESSRFYNCVFDYSVTNLGSNTTFVGCYFGDSFSNQISFSNTYLTGCSNNNIFYTYDNETELAKKVKAMNPDMNLLNTSGEAIPNYYATADIINEISSIADSAYFKAQNAEEDVEAVLIRIEQKADKATTLSGYGITDAYTKTEINSKLSSVYKYQGTVTWHLILNGYILNDSGFPFEVGQVWNIEEDDTIPAEYTISGTDITINAGDNIAVGLVTNNIPKFDKLSATIDLSNYATKDEVSNLVNLREATFEEIDAALGAMEASYSEILSLTNEIISEQEALVGGEE